MSKNCSVCGALTDDSTVYCYACGSRFEEKKAEEAPAEQIPDASVQANRPAVMLGIGEEEPAPAPAPTPQQTSNTYQQPYGSQSAYSSQPAYGSQSTVGYSAPQPANTYQQSGYRFQSEIVSETMGTGAWLGTILLSTLGIVGIGFLIYWAFGSETIEPKRSYAKAMLIIQGIALALSIILYGIAFMIGFSSAYM